MVVTGENRNTGKKSVSMPLHQHKFHTDFRGIEPGPRSCGKRGDHYLKFQILVHVDHIMFIFP
jgi:hypothetical protein